MKRAIQDVETGDVIPGFGRVTFSAASPVVVDGDFIDGWLIGTAPGHWIEAALDVNVPVED